MRRSRRLGLSVEQLETRSLLSATPGLDQLSATPTIAPAVVTYPNSVGLTPAQVRQAYGFNQVSFAD